MEFHRLIFFRLKFSCFSCWISAYNGDVELLIHKCISCLSSLRRSSSMRFLTAIASRCTSSSVNKDVFHQMNVFLLVPWQSFQRTRRREVIELSCLLAFLISQCVSQNRNLIKIEVCYATYHFHSLVSIFLISSL